MPAGRIKSYNLGMSPDPGEKEPETMSRLWQYIAAAWVAGISAAYYFHNADKFLKYFAAILGRFPH